MIPHQPKGANDSHAALRHGFSHQNKQQKKKEGEVDPQLHPEKLSRKNGPASHLYPVQISIRTARFPVVPCCFVSQKSY
jgi:hypothetical protein